MTPRPFGSLASGETVEAFTLTNDAGASAEVLTYGGIIASLRMPDRENRMADVVLGFKDLEGYVDGRAYFGAIVGRIAGRVSNGRISVDGCSFALACNEGANHLHGGCRGLDRRVWDAEPSMGSDGASSLRLSYTSPDGEEGYPGTVSMAVTYTLTASNALVVDTVATTDRTTPLSLAHHSYFNLAGEGSGTVSQHEFMILADEYVPAGDGMRLTDRREQVAGSSADLRFPRRLQDALPALHLGHGDIYVLRVLPEAGAQSSGLAARAQDTTSGRVLDVFTDESCLQFYTGVALDGTTTGKTGRSYGPHAGFCLECHGYPNALAAEGFGDILVRPGRPQRRRTVYAFSTC
jgi:aldose 1-epimerase